MVIGNGDIAQALRECELNTDIIYLASGLSNSSKVTFKDLRRELELIERYKKFHVVYFSSLSVFSNETEGDYQYYKKIIERFIYNNCREFSIVRIGNINWGTNPHTLINYLKKHPKAKRNNVTRYIIDKEDFKNRIQTEIKEGRQQTLNWLGKPINVKKDL